MALKLGLELEAVILGSTLGYCAWDRSALGNSLGARLGTALGSRPGDGAGCSTHSSIINLVPNWAIKLLGNNSVGSELGALLGNKLGSVLGIIALGTELGTPLGSELGRPTT